jgi:hypothetical protein
MAAKQMEKKTECYRFPRALGCNIGWFSSSIKSEQDSNQAGAGQLAVDSKTFPKDPCTRQLCFRTCSCGQP